MNSNVTLCMALKLQENNLPRSWKQAINNPLWLKVVNTEKSELEYKGAWKFVERPNGHTILPGLWRFKVKKNEKGEIVRHKARWCADGSRENFQRPPETKYSPVAEMSTIRMIFALAAAKGQVVLQADFPNAYLNADLDEKIYVAQPKGIEELGKEDHVCLLRKALYGTSISGRMWHETLKSTMVSLGYQQSKIDPCLFYRNTINRKDILTVYVDDVLVTSSGGPQTAEEQLNELAEKHDIKKLGKAAFMLGVGVHQENEGITLEQETYAREILEEADFLESKPRGTPWDLHQKENKEPLETAQCETYRRMIGQLMYLNTISRPDLAFAIGRLAAGFKQSTVEMWERMKRALKYLNATKGTNLKYRRNTKTLQLETYVDSAYSVDPVRRQSITGYIVCLAGAPIAWRSHLQDTVADSPNVAEYIGIHDAATATLGIQNLLAEIGMDVQTPIIYEDNDGARRLATDGMGKKKARHIEMKYHAIQDICKEGKVSIK